MKENLTEVVFIMDRSGSMCNLVDDTIGGYNELLHKQKQLEGEVFVTTVLFDNDYELLHDRVNLKAVPNLTRKEYYVRGSTALLDAIGKTVTNIDVALANTTEENRPAKVLFVIITDGFENASQQYNYNTIKSMILHQTNKYSWEFIFLGANIDAVGVAAALGIKECKTANYHADSLGTSLSYQAIDNAISHLRVMNYIEPNLNSSVKKDYENKKINILM